MSDERLPFPIHGARTGEDAPTDAAGEAARLLYVVNLIASTAKVPVFSMSKDIEGGQVHAAVYGPLAFKWVTGAKKEKEELPAGDDVRLVWMPEGFVITPRTLGAPDGFGMPPTEDGKGTPGGPLTQVIINRFKDNQYPDALYKSQGLGLHRVNCANLFFMDWEREPASGKTPFEDFSIGMETETGPSKEWQWTPQFDAKARSRWSQNYKESEGKKWLCHRPMFAREYEDEARRIIREDTNLIREQMSLEPLSPPLRGREGELSADILYQMSFAGAQDHERPDFREGYRTPDERIYKRFAWAGYMGENLHSTEAKLPAADFARIAVDRWEASPGHYANMVTDWGDSTWAITVKPPLFQALDVSTKTGLNLDKESPPLLSATSATQIFTGSEYWVHPSLTQNNRADALSVTPWAQGHGYLPLSNINFNTRWSLDEEPGGDPEMVPNTSFFLHGRGVMFRTQIAPHMMILAGAVCKNLAGIQSIRICVAESPVPFHALLTPREMSIVIYEGRAEDFLNTRTELARLERAGEMAEISIPHFSESGDKLVFSYAELVVADSALRWVGGELVVADVAIPKPTEWEKTVDHAWGDILHFMEWTAGGEFVEIATDSLDISVSAQFGYIDLIPKSVETHQAQCSHSCKYLADYDGETVVYATIQVDCDHVYNAEPASPTSHIGHMRGSLVFPDGTSLPYQNIRTLAPTMVAGDYPTTFEPEVGAHGFFLQFLHLDILRPHLNVFVRQEISEAFQVVPTDSDGVVAERVASSVTTLYVGKDEIANYGESLKQAPFGAAGGSLKDTVSGSIYGIVPLPFGVYEMRAFDYGGSDVITFLPFKSAYYDAHGTHPDFNHLPMRAFKASVVSPSTHYYQSPRAPDTPSSDGVRWRASSGAAAIPRHLLYCVGPTFVTPMISDRLHRVEAATYKDEFIVAGLIERTIGKKENHADGERTYFHKSSLDLKEISGYADLKQNILPIGVIR